MKYQYPAVFTYDDDAILVDFPGLDGCYTDGVDEKEAFENAEDVLNLELMSRENHGEPIPAPADIRSLPKPEHGFIGMIAADTVAYRKKVDTKTVRKNVSIPSWLNQLAVEHNINFSNVLQNALLRELHAV